MISLLMIKCNSRFMKLNRVFVLLIFTLSCSTSKEKTEYKYFAELNRYLNQHHSIKIDGGDLYLLMIPVGSCTPCVQESLTMAIEQSKNHSLKTVLMADNRKMFIEQDELIKQLNSETTYYDSEGKRNDFETGIFAPVIFHFEDGELTYYKELSVSNIHEAKQDLKWL